MYSAPIRPDEIFHYGIKRRSGRYPWGSGDRPYQSLESTLTKTRSPEELSNVMRTFSYSDYTKLQSPEETLKKRSGSCHDQVIFELEELSRMGLKPKAEFLIEYNPESSNGGTTHSFVYYEENGKTYWFENAWSGKEGIHEFDNFDSIKEYIVNSHKNGEFGSKDDFPYIEFSNFGKHQPGETLQELVDNALSSDDIEYSENQLDKMEKLKHSEGEVNFKMYNTYNLIHGGPGSGRYPLGSGDRPYQKFEGSRRKSGGISGYISAKKREKTRVLEELKKKEKERHEADKERVLKSGTPKEVSNYKGELSRQELQDVYSRLNLERMIDQMSSSEKQGVQKTIDRVMSNIRKTTGWVAEGVAAYNILASVYNSTVDQSRRLPVIKITRN